MGWEGVGRGVGREKIIETKYEPWLHILILFVYSLVFTNRWVGSQNETRVAVLQLS